MAAAAATGADLEDVSLATAVGSLAGMWIVYAAVIALTLAARGSGRPADDLGLRIKLPDPALGLLLGLASSFIVVNVVYVVLRLTSVVDDADMDKLDDPAKQLGDAAQGTGFLVLALFVGIGAPVVEEILFRGFLQPAAIRRFGPAAGIVVTALVFGVIHFQALQFPALFAFGLVLGIMAHRFGRLGPSIFAHMVFNGLTLASLALTP